MKQRESTVNLKIISLCMAVGAASGAFADTTVVTPELQKDLATSDMTTSSLAEWMQEVLDERGLTCSEVLSMGGQVPITDPKTRRSVAIAVNCEERSYFITVSIKNGWVVH